MHYFLGRHAARGNKYTGLQENELKEQLKGKQGVGVFSFN